MYRLSVVRKVGGVLLVLLLSGVAATETEIEQVKPKNGKAYEVGSDGALSAALKSEEITVVEPESRQHPSESDPKAIVYFYRYEQDWGSGLRPGVFCDGVRLARIANGSYFIANLDPGHHVLRSAGKESIIEMDLVDGQTYYIQVVMEPGLFKGQGVLYVRDSVQGMSGISPGTLNPLQAKIHLLLLDPSDPPLPDPELGSIGVTVKTPKGRDAVWVYFVRLEDDEDAFSAEYVIRSNYYGEYDSAPNQLGWSQKERQVYLLNAKPGYYVAVAARLPSIHDYVPEAEAFFSMEMIPLTEVTVWPGQMVFMGDFLVNLGTKVSNADEAQTHYHSLISPDAISPDVAVQYGLFDAVLDSLLAGAIDKHGIHDDRLPPEVDEWLSRARPRTPHRKSYKAKLKSVAKDAEREGAFWGLARDKVFRGAPAWQKQVQRQLEALGEGGQ